MSQYEVPPKPTAVGQYNWPATLAFVLVVIVGNFAATQYMAYRFGYQAALGLPIWHYSGHALYKPFMWIIWTLHNLMNADQRVISTLKVGVAVAVGSIVGGAFVRMWVQARMSRKLGEGADDLHGSAKWATRVDIEKTGLLTQNPGCYVGGWQHDGRLHYLRHNGPGHILAFAPARSGKNISLVFPTLCDWPESAVIYDIKGENWAKTSGFRSTIGLCLKFSPTEENTTRFNPLGEIRLYTPYDVKDAQNIAEMLAKPFGEVTHEHGYFFETAATLLSGAILYCCYAADAEQQVACLADVMDFLNSETMLEEMGTSDHELIKTVAHMMSTKEDRNWDGVISTAQTALKVFHDPLLAAATSASDFTVDDLVNHVRPISLYMIVPPSDKERLRPLVRLMLTVIINRLTERMEFWQSQYLPNRHRLLLMIDEFPTLSSMPLLSDALAYMAGYGIKAYLIAQDVQQIKREYGHDESVTSNCGTWIAFAPNNYETAQLLSNMTGRSTIARANQSFSGPRFSPMPQNQSVHVDYTERPLLAPDEFLRLRAPEKTGEGAHERIVKPGAMVVFCSGAKPIRGTQMLYFLDAELLRRSMMPPPTELVMIADGQEWPQPPLDRTQHIVSRIEPEPPADEEQDGVTLSGPLPW